MSFASMTARLRLNISDFSRGLSRAARSMRSFATTASASYGVAAAALNKHNLHLKDTVRIIHGIVIAQAFYNAVGAISDATSALWKFNKELDYMQITYSALFGSSELATDFMGALQEHSINTIFDYQELADASKKLLAYGIEYENLMFIMNGLTDLGAMSGDKDSLTRIARALGQIYTKGKLGAEEMRQLADAYVPIYEIVQSSFGLTDKQMSRVGDLNLPAHQVINAVIDYANAEFGSVGDAAMYTITGLENRVVDSMKVMGTAMIRPVTNAYKSFLAYLSNGLEAIRGEFETGGFGAVFEHLVPSPEKQQVIRQFLANVRNLFMSLASIGSVVGQVLGNMASVFVTSFNIIAPVITVVSNLLSAFLRAILDTRVGATILRIALVGAAAAFVLLKVHAVGALIITAVTKAVYALSKALILLAAIVVKHPILSLIAAIAVGLIGVSTASNTANNGISGLFDTLSGISGASSGDILQRTEQELLEGATAADQFNNRLEAGADAADALKDGVGGVGKAAKDTVNKLHGLLSFDEVFKLQDPSKDASGSGIGGAIDDYAGLLEGFEGLGDALIPDIPDFSEYGAAFADGLFGGISQGIMDKLAGSPGWLIGGLAGIGKVLSTSFSKLFGTSLGSAIAGIFKGGSIKNIFKSIGAAFKGAGLKSLLKGGVIGAAIGFVTDGLASTLWGRLSERFKNADTETAAVGQTIGSVLGAIVGGIFGGPAGAIIGSAIGTFAGGFVGLFWDPIKNFFVDTGKRFGEWVVNTAQGLASWASETLTGLSTWWSDTKAGFEDWWSNTWTGLSTWWSDTTTGFSDWWYGTWTGLSTWWSDTKTGFSDWWDETTALFTDWDKLTFETISNWWNNTWNKLSTWWSDTWAGFDTWAGDTLLLFGGWVADTFSAVVGWAGDTLLEITTWIDDTLGGFVQWSVEALGAIAGWAIDALGEFTGWAVDVLGEIGGWALDFIGELVSWAGDALEPISTWASDALGAIGQWFIDMGVKFSDGLGDLGDAISDFFSFDNLWSLMSTGLNAVTRKLGDWWGNITSFGGNLWDGFTGLVGGAWDGIVNFGAGLLGHAEGGVFDREHVARFAEGNKREAIIPLENQSAMKPFVDAVSGGLVGTLAPMLANANAAPSSQLPPLYVGTLIADDRGIEQLYRKFQIIQLQENDRRGLPNV